MKYAVAYYTRSGNTKKVAEAIADVLVTEARDISLELPGKVDVLFLGSSLYAFKYDESVEKFIEKNADKIGMIVSFSTSATGKSTARFVKECAEKNNIKFYHQAFKCPGSFLITNPGRPHEKDLRAARNFTKSVMNELGD
ncbi:MAG: flavodoxin [Lachnospiraceae bacterium]|nr:flavodoxin [Lachnospiraceae bacterium]